MTVKSVGYAFPTSPLATQLGRSKEGCYYIGLAADEQTPDYPVSGPFATKDAAIAALPDYPGEVSRWCLSAFKLKPVGQ